MSTKPFFSLIYFNIQNNLNVLLIHFIVILLQSQNPSHKKITFKDIYLLKFAR